MLHTLLLLAVLLLSVPALAQEWHSQGEHAGFHLDTRAVPRSAFEEVRVTTQTALSAAQVCEAVWGPHALEAGFKRRDVLRETPNERWTYEQLSAPVVSDRDYTLHVRKDARTDGGCLVTFDTQNDKGPPPRAGFVRIPTIRGSWDIATDAKGGARVVYTVYSEPGGGLPAFLTRAAQRCKAVDWMKLVLGRVQAAHASR